AAQNDTNGAIVALASPYLNKKIHEMTDGDTAKDKAANLAAHALLSAVEFQVTGKDPLTGAVAGVTGEATATFLTKALYDKTSDQLTASEKENISMLSQIAGGLAGALTAKANGTSKENGGGMALAVAGAETAKRAVENNTFFIGSTDQEYVKSLQVKAKADEVTKFINEQATKDAKELGIPQYIAIDAGIYKFGGKIAINTRTGDLFYSQVPSLSVISDAHSSSSFGFGVEVGWIPTLSHEEIKNIGPSINNILGGASIGGKACYVIYCASVGSTLPIGPSNKTHQMIGIGIGEGYSFGGEVMKKW
ncbi:VENN motif pre-toxin domain-containing protein, partial [Rodentibacter trehalosifermentans]